MAPNERRPFHVVEVPLGDGDGVVRVHVDETDESVVRVGRGSRTVARAEESLDRMLEVVRPVADAFVGRCQNMVRQPDEATLEFGMSVSADAKILIAESSASANFSVSLTWHNADASQTRADRDRHG
ncbi:CU044_2847 family protein [Streptomyces anulatus]|uniref:CU044_2847 family protein n=1 Tax=Streptomyces anulatus TaxID=1892 RepID=UPI001C25E62A|nr:CU044_2847 family protein [Streptomyces anulatus]